MEGYAVFAEKYHQSRMSSAFNKASAVLSKREMNELGWQRFQGTAHEYRVTRNRIMDESDNPKEEFLGMEGYAAFAGKYHESRMESAFKNISAVLSPKEMGELGWQQFRGTAHEYHATKNWIVDENGNLREEFLGMEGYASFAKEYYESGMLRAFINTSAVLSKKEMDELNWQQFQGTVAEYRVTRSRIMDENGNFREEFIGMEGYASFAEEYYESKMLKAFTNASAVLSKKEMDELDWKVFRGIVAEYRVTKNRIMDENGNLREEFLGMEGYAAFAEKYHESRMPQAFVNTSAILSKREMDDLGWQHFQGTAHEYRVTRNRIMDENGNLRGEFLGMEGYAAFAGQYYESRMQQAFRNISAALSKREMDKLDWHIFRGTVAEYRVTRNRIMDENGNPREEFLGMEGYAAFAEEYKESKMGQTFSNVSAVLTKREMDGLGWQKFLGTVAEYRITRNRIMDERGNPREEFLGMRGHAAFADQYYESGMTQSFKNTSAVLSKREMARLGWQYFQGTVAKYHATRDRIIDENGNLREEFLGMRGHAAFADQYYESNMFSAFTNMSAVLGGKEEMKRLGLGWKSFFGSSSQYHELINFFKITDRNLLKGLEGQKLTADTIFEGNTLNTYKNVSVLRETLLGDREEFNRLGWTKRKF